LLEHLSHRLPFLQFQYQGQPWYRQKQKSSPEKMSEIIQMKKKNRTFLQKCTHGFCIKNYWCVLSILLPCFSKFEKGQEYSCLLPKLKKSTWKSLGTRLGLWNLLFINTYLFNAEDSPTDCIFHYLFRVPNALDGS
jgi:hypothetical protein